MNRNTSKPKKILALLIITVMVLTTGLSGVVYAQAASISDIEGHWAYKDISAWIQQGLVSGYEDGTFKPDKEISRVEFAVLVNRSFKLSETAGIAFTDVKNGDWFFQDVAKAVKAGYMRGDGNGTFRPNAGITRQEVAVIIARLKSLKEDLDGTKAFNDADKFAAWSKGYIGAIANAKYMNGYPDGSFGASKNITRAEAVVTLNKALMPAATIEAIAEQLVYVGSIAKLTAKTVPADAALTVKSSNTEIVTVTANASSIEFKGVATGDATITVTAKKDGYRDGTTTFKVSVKTPTVGTTSSVPAPTTTPTPTPNTKPVITVVEPDGTTDGVITLTVGTAFVAPTVTANDAEDGNITSKIVKAGEDKVDTSKVGEYVLTYNVSDSKNLAADERKVTVKVIADTLVLNKDYTVQILNSTVPGEKQVYVTMANGVDGSLWKAFVKRGTGKVELTYNAEKNRFEGSTLEADAIAANVTFEKKAVAPVLVLNTDYTVQILNSTVPGEKQVYVTMANGVDGSLWKAFVKRGTDKVELTYNAEKNRFQRSTLEADAIAANVTFQLK